jgi:hypothetical protein
VTKSKKKKLREKKDMKAKEAEVVNLDFDEDQQKK